MSKVTKVGLSVLVLGGIGTGAFLFVSKNAAAKSGGITSVAVEKGTIVDKALAVGQIVPDQEIQVKSQISGIVKETYVEVGDRVEIGQPLFRISPDPTPLELAEAERAVQLAQVAFDKIDAELSRSKSLWSPASWPRTSSTPRRREFDQTRIKLAQEKDKLALLKEGRIRRTVGRRRLGDPRLGRRHGARAQGQPGRPGRAADHLPGRHRADDARRHEDAGVQGHGRRDRRRQARGADAGTHPDRRAAGQRGEGHRSPASPPRRARRKAPRCSTSRWRSTPRLRRSTLRAGYSANADIIIQEKKDVLLVPERLVTLDEGQGVRRDSRGDARGRAAEEGDHRSASPTA